MKKRTHPFVAWLLSSGITAIVSGIAASVGTLVVTDIQDSRSKERELRNDAISKLREKQYEAFVAFASEDDGLLDVSKAYIDAVLKKRSLKKPAEELAAQIKKQVKSVEKLNGLFVGAEVESGIIKYQKALLAFSSSIEGFTSEATADEWSNNFASVVNSKTELRGALRRAIGHGA